MRVRRIDIGAEAREPKRDPRTPSVRFLYLSAERITPIARTLNLRTLLALGVLGTTLAGCAPQHRSGSSSAAGPGSGTVSILNVSYDPTRELYADYNAAFAAYWKTKSGQTVEIKQSHGGSGKQARAVIDGLGADVVTLGAAYDTDAVAKAGLIAPGWRTRLPNNSAPYISTVLLVVRHGNPKNIHDFSDLARPGITVITPNPKTSAGGRWAYLAAYGNALKQSGGTPATAQEFIAKMYQNVQVLDSGARGATATFVQRGLGDVLIAWEDEANLITKKMAPGQYDIVVPSTSIIAEPPVAVVDANVEKHHTREVAMAYLSYLFSPEGQQIAARHYYRPQVPAEWQKVASQFPVIKLFSVDDTFGGWENANKTHFADGGVFDQIYRK